MRVILSTIVAVLLLVPGWTGLDRLPLIDAGLRVHARGWTPAGGWPSRAGALEPVGALALTARGPAFGGVSALALHDGRATLLSDGGNVVTLAIRGGRLTTVGARPLPAGPGTGWAKESRDTESLARDPATGAWWVGYERANEIWRYDAALTRATGRARPAAMRWWPPNSGAESLLWLGHGRMLAIAEGRQKGPVRAALLFRGDPTRDPRPVALGYLPPRGFSPSDATVLPDGDLLILNRQFRYPFRFTCIVTLVRRDEVRPGAVMRGRPIATLGPDLLNENCEGIAATRERGATMVWIATDNDLMFWRPTLLAKFRLHLADTPSGPPSRSDGGPPAQH